ncbi:hypothetical protein [Desulfoferrobacter suflitae]|uniref:hypothetical protein n=1 Tax=Desulfoferrobacter suflitae TaxID=2865782 RepID=UPI002164032B|nr:hypothetical protein [Desulfoferrobacter suflitae]MCK8601465.1 hypothetical protein [Desulfoferrobacter suflitae]
MKKMQMIVVACVALIGATAWSGLHAAGTLDGPGKFMKYGCHRPDGGSNSLGKYLQENMMVDVLAQLTKQPVETVRQQVREKHFKALLHEYNVDRETFRAEMRAKKIAQINQLVTDGYLSADQGKAIVDKMEARAKRHQLMVQLIEKGIADGTITQQDAQLLMPRRR